MTKLLDKIKSPADIRSMNTEQLSQLAEEIRELIIVTTSENGGHIGPNLGVVELTLALHYVFDTPNDKIIWDVGHQCYAHKIITGRKDGFSTIRQPGGLSGFCQRDESEYDSFTTGHSSSSISQALGMAEALQLAGADNKTVAVIGDASLTGGVAFEALNQAGDRKTPLLVILNDNNMSIDHNVGALNRYLSHLRTNPHYGKAKQEVHSILNHIPWVGTKLAKLLHSSKTRLKSLVVKDMLFENLGFTCLGPTDGHDIAELIKMLQRAARINRPTLLHTITVKGKGYAPAEEKPNCWHGVDPFDIETGKPKNSNFVENYTDVFGKSIVDLAEKDEDIVAITAAMTEGTGLKCFSKMFPNRFYDIGIAEQHALSFAAGLANAGKKPIFAVYSSFLQRGYDQLMEDVCMQRLPVVITLDRAGIVGSDGYSHQGIYDLSYLRTIPGLTIMAPSSAKELTAMLEFAVGLNQPVVIRYPKGAAAQLPIACPDIQLGQAQLVFDGNDLAFFALGSMVTTALEAARILKDKGIEARVINARFAAPLDEEMLHVCADECRGRIITVEENVREGGFGMACSMSLSDTKASILTAALPHSFLPHGQRDAQLAELGLSAQKLVQMAANQWFDKR